MKIRKGFLAIFCLWVMLVPVSADETADDIVAMMGWWEKYGRYWDEMGADTSITSDEEMAFAGLEEAVAVYPAYPERSSQ